MLQKLVFQSHIRLGLETNASPQNVGSSRTLLRQRVNDWSARRRQRCLRHVAEDAKHTVEATVFLGSGDIMRTPLDQLWYTGKSLIAK